MTTLGDLAQLVGSQISVDSKLKITGVSEIKSGIPGTITFLTYPRYRKYLTSTQASAVIVSKEEKVENIATIRVENPLLAFAKILEHFSGKLPFNAGIHSTALIGNRVKLGDKVAIGANSIIEDNAEIGSNTQIGAQSFVGQNSVIGKNTELKAFVTLYHNCVLGNNVLIHSGAVIGSDGFGFVTDKNIHHKIHQLGRVVIENDVEIGANSTIDRGTIGDTIIGEGSKIDNLVHIAHNVILGKGCLVTAQVGFSGSAKIGDYVSIGGQAGVRDHVEVGSHAQLAGKTGVTKSIPGDKMYAGMPAREIHEKNKIDALMARLPKLMDRIKELESKVAELKSKK